MAKEYVILVDENDQPIGEMEKMEAHVKGLLHRAFSGFIFNDKKELLIQQRALHKYHNPGIWSNTVCSHPRPQEAALEAVKRRIFEEMGFDSDFIEIGQMLYKSEFPNGLIEHELDHIFIASYQDQKVNINPEEVTSFRWIGRKQLEKEIKQSPSQFSYWMKEILSQSFVDKWF